MTVKLPKNKSGKERSAGPKATVSLEDKVPDGYARAQIDPALPGRQGKTDNNINPASLGAGGIYQEKTPRDLRDETHALGDPVKVDIETN